MYVLRYMRHLFSFTVSIAGLVGFGVYQSCLCYRVSLAASKLLLYSTCIAMSKILYDSALYNTTVDLMGVIKN